MRERGLTLKPREKTMQERSMRKMWAVLALILIVSFSWLGLLGNEIHRQAPPIPSAGSPC